MSYLLQFPAAAAYIVTGRLILGAGYSITFELQRDSDVDIYISSDGGDELRYIVGTGWQLKSGTTWTYSEPELIPPIGEKFTVTFTRDGSTSNRSIQLNGGTPVSKVTASFNLWVNNIGQGYGGVYRAFKLYKCTITSPANPAYNRVFDADASGGTGTILPNTLTGTNNGTLTGAWPSDDSEWVFYQTTVAGVTFPIVVGASIQTIAASAVSICQISKPSIATSEQQIVTSAVAVSTVQKIVGATSSQSKIDSFIECSLLQQAYINPQSQSQSQGAVFVPANASVLVPAMFGELDAGTILVSQSSPDSQSIIVPASVQIADTSIPSIIVTQSVSAQTSIQQAAVSPIWVTLTSGNQIEVPDIELNPRRISFALTTERQRISRTTQLYSLELTTPRYQINRG